MVYSPTLFTNIFFTDADTTTPEGAVEKFKSLIDDLALTNKGKFARFREGNKIPLHYQEFSCSNEQIFADVVAGDRR